MRPAVDPNYTEAAGVQDYLLSRAAIAPMDVRIEAVMYAQNGSLFGIPGSPMNTEPKDTRDAAFTMAANNGLPAGTIRPPAATSNFYPVFCEPYDCRNTLA